MRLLQGGQVLGHAWNVRIQRGLETTRCAFDLSGDAAVALDQEKPCLLEDEAGSQLKILVAKSFYSWGSFRVHGSVETDGDGSD